jgi:hypothetical protein
MILQDEIDDRQWGHVALVIAAAALPVFGLTLAA